MPAIVVEPLHDVHTEVADLIARVAHLEARNVELLGECAQCGEVRELTDELRCPVCGTADVRLCGGETVLIKSCAY